MKNSINYKVTKENNKTIISPVRMSGEEIELAVKNAAIHFYAKNTCRILVTKPKRKRIAFYQRIPL